MEYKEEMFTKKKPTVKCYKILKTSIKEFEDMSLKTIKLIKNYFNEIDIKKNEPITKETEDKLDENEFISTKIVNPLLNQYENILAFFKVQINSLLEENPDKMEKLGSLVSNIQKSIDDSVKKFEIDIVQAKRDAEKVIYTKVNGVSYVYIGQFLEKYESKYIKQGKGTLTNGIELYKGDFENDVRHGFGIQVFEGGVSFKGRWENGSPVNGMWNDHNGHFYGVVNKDEKWKLGEEIKSDVNYVTNYKKLGISGYQLYYKEKTTGLKNLKLDQKIDIKALKGKARKSKPAMIQFVNGIDYRGFWKNFKPHGEGMIVVPKEEPKKQGLWGKEEIIQNEFKILSSNGKVLLYQSIRLIRTEPGLIDCKQVRIEYPDGSFYEGYVDSDYRFIGDATLFIANTKKGTSMEIRGVFSDLDGLIFTFKSDSKRTSSIPLLYLKDTVTYHEAYPDSAKLFKINLTEDSR